MSISWSKLDGALTDNLMGKIIDTLECSVCSDIMHVPVISSCGHSFCYDCCTSWFENKATCPTCRHELDSPPILNVSLRDISRHIVNMMLEHGAGEMSEAELEELRKRRDENEKSFQYDLQHKKLFGDTFKSVLTMIDRSDGVARCANCHWEAQGSECLNCGAVFRFSRDDDTFYESVEDMDEDGQIMVYDSDDEENRYDSEDSFIDGRGNDEISRDVLSDNDILSDDSQQRHRRGSHGSDNDHVHRVDDNSSAGSWAGFQSGDDRSFEEEDVEDLQTAVDHFNSHTVDWGSDVQSGDDDDDQIDFELTTRSMGGRRRPVIELSDED